MIYYFFFKNYLVKIKIMLKVLFILYLGF